MSAAPTDCRVPDPTDAKADGNFGSSGSNRRAGYSKDKLANAEYWARKGGTLNAGEGLVLCGEIDRLRERLAELEQELPIAQMTIGVMREYIEQLRSRLEEAERVVEAAIAEYEQPDVIKSHALGQAILAYRCAISKTSTAADV